MEQTTNMTKDNLNTNTNDDTVDLNTSDYLTNIMSEKLVDQTIVERYGTSIKMSMGREYKSYLNDKYHKLKKELRDLKKHSEDLVEIKELVDFFNFKRRVIGITKENYNDIEIKEMELLFDYMDQDPSKSISM